MAVPARIVVARIAFLIFVWIMTAHLSLMRVLCELYVVSDLLVVLNVPRHVLSFYYIITLRVFLLMFLEPTSIFKHSFAKIVIIMRIKLSVSKKAQEASENGEIRRR